MTNNNDIYRPTKAEQALASILCDPTYINSTITEICEAAEVSRQTYYEAFKRGNFVTYYKDLAKELITRAVAPVINSALKEAKGGSFQHQKLLLEMAAMHSDSIDLNVSGTLATINSDMDQKDAARLYAELVKGDKK